MRTILFAVSMIWIAGCSTTEDNTGSATDEINCASDLDCANALGGGVCGPTTHTCRPLNRCESNVDCTLPEICVRTSLIGAVCARPNTAPQPTPAALCTASNQCPSWQVCGPDATCHARYCGPNGGCPTGEICHPICPTDPLPSPTASTLPPYGICQPEGGLIEQCPIQTDPPPPDGGVPTPSSGSPTPGTHN